MPGLATIGQLEIGDVQFTTDPDVYQPFNWPKRYSAQPGLNGAVTIQEFGRWAADATIHIESGDQFLTTKCVDALDALYEADGTTYTLTDWLGNEFTVYITAFVPIPSKLADRDDDEELVGSLYRYTMDLLVVAITKRRGTTYGGS